MSGNIISKEACPDQADKTKAKVFKGSVSSDTSLKETHQGHISILKAIEKYRATVKCSPEEFCLSQSPCTLQQFDSLEATNKLRALMKIINKYKDDKHLLLLIFTSLKCAHLSQLSAGALQLAIALFEEAFNYARRTNQEVRVQDYYLKQLGLLRSEESFKSDYDIKSCRYALREALTSDEFANVQISNRFKMFLDNMDPQ